MSLLPFLLSLILHLDERAKVLLKSLLDAATEKALLAYSKIIVDAQLGVSNTPYSSQSVQPKAMPYLEPPVSPDVENASPSTIQSSNAQTNLCVNNAWKNEQSLIKPTPQDSGSEHSKFSVSLNKPEGRKKCCRVCKQNSMKQQNSAKNLNKDGNESDQRHDEAYWIDGNSKGSHELRLKGLKSAVTFNEESKQKRNSEIECQPSVASTVGSKFVKIGSEFVSGKIDKHREDSESNSFQEVANAMKYSESVMPSSSLQLYGENADSLEANNAAFDHNLSMADNSTGTKMQSVQKDGSVAVGEMSFAKRQNGDGSVAMRETNCAERQNVKEIVERIESLNRSQKNYQTCQYVCGSQVPPSQDDVGKKSSMHSMKVRQDTPLRNPVARLEEKSTPSVPSIPLSAGSIVASHKRHLPRQTFIRPTLLDYDDYHKKITPKRSYVDSEEELDETTSSSSNGRSLEMSDEEASSSSNPHSQELSDATASSSSNPRSLVESYQTASSSSSSSPHSSYSWTSQQQTTGSGGSSSRGSDEDPEDYYDRGDHPPRVKGPSKRYRSPSHKKKATGRLRGLKNKLGLIFHHHHHHHHHHHDDNDDAPKKDMKHHDKACQKKAVEKFGKSVVSGKKKQKAGHFRALVKGLMKHSKHSKKSKPSEDGIGRQFGRIQNGHDKKHWWKMFQRHRRGVRLPNRGRVKLGIPRKNKKPRLKTLK
ncbi:serine-rich adhesin for platelet [Salix suchowensis]|nr:serine-rich adhesin for platelet [Salix suchowensis]